MPADYDVAIVGGGPAGSTAGALLKKYNPDLSVAIFEKEKFPRDHVGESQLPLIGRILNEMGVWERVEAAGFPIKVGATYRWGSSPDLWDFNFAPPEQFETIERPGKYEGVRISTAWQVDRAIYDKILLDFAAELGCEVFEETAGEGVVRDDPDTIDHLTITRDGERDEVRARHYVDASGRPGALRRKLPIEVTTPGSLKNVAFWDYWENAEWAAEIGVGGHARPGPLDRIRLDLVHPARPDADEHRLRLPESGLPRVRQEPGRNLSLGDRAAAARDRTHPKRDASRRDRGHQRLVVQDRPNGRAKLVPHRRERRIR